MTSEAVSRDKRNVADEAAAAWLNWMPARELWGDDCESSRLIPRRGELDMLNAGVRQMESSVQARRGAFRCD